MIKTTLFALIAVLAGPIGLWARVPPAPHAPPPHPAPAAHPPANHPAPPAFHAASPSFSAARPPGMNQTAPHFNQPQNAQPHSGFVPNNHPMGNARPPINNGMAHNPAAPQQMGGPHFPNGTVHAPNNGAFGQPSGIGHGGNLHQPSPGNGFGGNIPQSGRGGNIHQPGQGLGQGGTFGQPGQGLGRGGNNHQPGQGLGQGGTFGQGLGRGGNIHQPGQGLGQGGTFGQLGQGLGIGQSLGRGQQNNRSDFFSSRLNSPSLGGGNFNNRANDSTRNNYFNNNNNSSANSSSSFYQNGGGYGGSNGNYGGGYGGYGGNYGNNYGGYGGGYGDNYGGYGGSYGGGYRPWAPYGWGSNYGSWNYGWVPPLLGGLGFAANSGWLLSPSDSFAYANPYYVEQTTFDVPSVFNYSVPIAVPTIVDSGASTDPIPSDVQPPANAAPAQPDEATLQQAGKDFDAARAAFREGDYPQAQTLVEKAIRAVPGDATLHQFRALVLFARGNYDDASATLYAVLATGPGWDWKTLIGFYANADTYTRQLRALEATQQRNPDAGPLHFLLAYHYLAVGSKDGAIRQLRHTVRLVPDDKLSLRLLNALLQDRPQQQLAAPPVPVEK